MLFSNSLEKIEQDVSRCKTRYVPHKVCLCDQVSTFAAGHLNVKMCNSTLNALNMSNQICAVQLLYTSRHNLVPMQAISQLYEDLYECL